MTLSTDPDNDCKGPTKEYVDGKLINTYGFADTFVLSEFLEGLTDGKTIKGTKADSGEGSKESFVKPDSYDFAFSSLSK